MSAYLQMFLDESEEQLDGLTEVLLVLEREPDSAEHLNEAFRLIHSIKGSAGLMGLDVIAALTHHLESRFERFRSGVERLEEPTMDLVLKCIDFLRDCMRRLRVGEALGSAADLLRELADLDPRPKAPAAAPADAESESGSPAAAPTPTPAAVSVADDGYHLVVRFEPDLPLVDLKARLIMSRLSNIGDVVSVHPAVETLEGIDALHELEVVLTTEQGADVIRAAADVDGVASVAIGQGDEAPRPETAAPAVSEAAPDLPPVPEPEPEAEPVVDVPPAAPAPAPIVPTPEPVAASPAPPGRVEKTKLGETMRVDIDRLDHLMRHGLYDTAEKCEMRDEE
jgi:two-component system chemotaxis sensor kinase CheA